MKQEDIQKALEALGKSGITVAGDLVLEKHVEHEVNNVEAGGIGIQIVNGARDGEPKSQNQRARVADTGLSDSGEGKSDKAPARESQRKQMPQESFAERVKDIMRKAATKNGEIMKSNARGHECEYTFYVNADAFCKAMDEMVAAYSDKLKALLGGTLATVQVTKVCFFIGQVVRMQVVNDEKLQAVDLLFAFEDYYSNLQTVQARLGDRNKSDDQDVALGTFQGLLKKHKS